MAGCSRWFSFIGFVKQCEFPTETNTSLESVAAASQVIEKAIASGYYPLVEQQVVLSTMSDRQLSVTVSEFEAAVHHGSRIGKRVLFGHAIRRYGVSAS